MSADNTQNPVRSAWPGWLFLAGLLLCGSIALRLSSHQFGLDVELEDMPILQFVAAYCALSIIFLLGVPRLIHASTSQDSTRFLLFIVVAGLLVRLVQLGATPLLEDDYNRYLWDGAVTAAGQNPFSVSPLTASGDQNHGLSGLRERAGAVFEGINYPEYRTIYPPVAQAAFALAHWVAPFSLDAWRGVLIALELGALALLIALLRRLGRSPLWCAFYWWNPLVIKEVANSAHMEPVLMLPVLAAMWFALVTRPIWASGLLAVAAGVKLWPMLLSAALFRRLLSDWKTLSFAAGLAAVLLAVFAWPILHAGLGSDSGFVAYAQKWRASSAAFLVANWLAGIVAGADSGVIARALLVLILASAIGWIVRRKAADGEHILHQMFLVTAALYLLSPSQFPWYFLWVAPFLCIFPVRGLMLAGALLPLHYLYFHYSARDIADTYRYGIVWFMWVPVWAVLVTDALRAHGALRLFGKERYAS